MCGTSYSNRVFNQFSNFAAGYSSVCRFHIHSKTLWQLHIDENDTETIYKMMYFITCLISENLRRNMRMKSIPLPVQQSNIFVLMNSAGGRVWGLAARSGTEFT